MPRITRRSIPSKIFSDEEWELTFAVNVHAMFYLTKAAIPHMKEGSSIINTASINADAPNPTLLAYATTKGAVGDEPSNISSHLLGCRSKPRAGLSSGPSTKAVSPIAKIFRVAGKRQIRLDFDTSGAIGGRRYPRRSRRRLYASSQITVAALLRLPCAVHTLWASKSTTCVDVHTSTPVDSSARWA
jgi:hypothetical protein